MGLHCIIHVCHANFYIQRLQEAEMRNQDLTQSVSGGEYTLRKNSVWLINQYIITEPW